MALWHSQHQANMAAWAVQGPRRPPKIIWALVPQKHNKTGSLMGPCKAQEATSSIALGPATHKAHRACMAQKDHKHHCCVCVAPKITSNHCNMGCAEAQEATQTRCVGLCMTPTHNITGSLMGPCKAPGDHKQHGCGTTQNHQALTCVVLFGLCMAQQQGHRRPPKNTQHHRPEEGSVALHLLGQGWPLP